MEDPATSSITSIWTSLNSWFTSTVFFILLNLMIATILFTSNLPTNNQQLEEKQEQQEEEEENHHHHRKQNSPATTDNHHNHHRNEPKFQRSPSILNRLKSFNFYPQRPEQEYSPETYYHLQSSIEVAATQYVFNPPLHFQHSDSDFDPIVSNRVPDSGTRFDSDTTRHQEDILKQDSDDNESEYGQVITNCVPGLGTRFGYDLTYQYILKQDSDSEYGQVITDVPNLGTRFGHDLTNKKEDTLKQDSDSEGAQLEEDDEFESLDEVYSRLKSGNVDRSNSDGAIHRKPLPPPAMKKKKKKMKKSASMKVGFTHFDEEEEIVEARRPATMRERMSPAVRAAAEDDDGDDDDVEVDAKADDFINKFKNDLMLQRIESIAGRSK